MNKILFTQNIEGEKNWLSQNHLDLNLFKKIKKEEFSTASILKNDTSNFYQISHADLDEDVTFLDSDAIKIKSVFSNNIDLLYDGKWWPISDCFLHDLEFTSTVKSNNFIILNLARSGTLFIRSLVSKRMVEYAEHKSVGTKEQNINLTKLIQDKQLNVFLNYRKDSWDWITSNLIAEHIGFYHYDDYPKDHCKKITADRNDLIKLLNIQLATWNFWCNLKCYLPDLNCYLLEFGQTISDYQHVSKHKAVPYNKEKLIENYDQIKEIYFKEFKDKIDKIILNGSTHLKKMNCKTDLSDLDIIT